MGLQASHSEVRAARKALAENPPHPRVQESLRENLEEAERTWNALHDAVKDLARLAGELANEA